MLQVFRNRSSLGAQVLLTLAFIAVAIRGVMPTGYMLTLDTQNRGITIIVCDGGGVETVSSHESVHNHAGSNPDSTHHSSGDPRNKALCHFSIVAGPMLDMAFISVAAAFTLDRFNYALQAYDLIVLSRAGSALPARGPPSLL